MKNIILFTLLTLYASACLHAQNTASKTVFDFESGNIDGWDKRNPGAGIDITQEDKHSGAYALIMVNGDKTSAWSVQVFTPLIEIVSGHVYNVSFWIRAVGGGGQGRISTAESGQLGGQYWTNFTVGDVWEQKMFSSLIAGSNTLQLAFDMGYIANKTYYIDDIVIEDISVDEPGDGVGTTPMAKEHEKFLGNVIANSVPASFDKYWNQVTPENAGKWGVIESQRGTMNRTALDRAYNHAKSKGYKFKYHTFVWGSQEPSWLGALSQADQKAAMENFMKTIATYYPAMDYIDVVNEPLHAPSNIREALGGSGATKWDWVIWSFQKAREYFPNSKLLINEYGIISDANAARTYVGIVNILKERNLIDGIGIQCHEFNLNDVSVQTMKTVLDILGATGLPIYVSELDISGNPAGNEESQYQIYKQKFPVLWEHESVAGVTLWGYITGLTWKTGTGIIAANGQERKAMAWLKDYIASEASKVPNKFESSVNNIFSNEDIKVYPNPATNYIIVEGNGIRRMDIYDISGKRLMTQRNDGYMNIESLEKGMYLLKVETENGTAEKKILKR